MDSRVIRQNAPANEVTCYVAPAVESVLNHADLERELYYAGTLTCDCGDDPWSNIPD